MNFTVENVDRVAIESGVANGLVRRVLEALTLIEVPSDKVVIHAVVGDGDWKPTAEEMQQLVDVLKMDDVAPSPDPLVIITRTGVQLNVVNGSPPRNIVHVVVGDPDVEPSEAELQKVVEAVDAARVKG